MNVGRPGKPHGAAAGPRVFDRAVDPVKAMPNQQLVILGRIEARMIERVATIAADRFANPGPVLNINTVSWCACAANTGNMAR